ncbi:MAG TPA: sulfite exporter TauE/SafE family protein [Thermomicrobiales bacterium]|nr:sulfite exporter TauE/SafE family protein [Thermomicrobiales bacterium]
MDIDYSLALAGAAFVASILGSMLGLGGGVFIVPLFTLYLGVDPKIAVGASAIAVVTNSVVGSRRHLSNGFVNVRLATMMEVTTAIGAIAGAAVAIAINADFLKALLGVLLVYAAFSMMRNRKVVHPNVPEDEPDPLGLMASFDDPSTGQVVRYIPRNLRIGISVSTLAGVMSGLLGIGGGVIKGPLMNLVMKMPVKAAAGTSSFMVGMTALATAAVFYADGKIDPQVAVPAMLGTFVGSSYGSHLTKRIHTERLVILFFVILTYLGISMLLSAFGITIGG